MPCVRGGSKLKREWEILLPHLDWGADATSPFKWKSSSAHYWAPSRSSRKWQILLFTLQGCCIDSAQVRCAFIERPAHSKWWSAAGDSPATWTSHDHRCCFRRRYLQHVANQASRTRCGEILTWYISLLHSSEYTSSPCNEDKTNVSYLWCKLLCLVD